MRPDEPDLVVVRAVAGRIFGTGTAIERVMEGVSTFVYRVRHGDETFYLRVLPEAGVGFAPEVWVQERLRAHGVAVPEVIYFDHRDASLGRSVMATREIPGRHVGHLLPDIRAREVLIEAGRHLAAINSIPVDGFGWIKRGRPHVGRLAAEHPTHRAFILEHFEADLGLLPEVSFSAGEIAAIRAVVQWHAAWLEAERAWLAHGDFDVTPIFQQDGRFTGIIDFGEIRGTDRWYDLGHFRMHDGETGAASLLDWLVEGYRSATPLPADYARRICLASLLIGVRSLGHHLAKGRHGAPVRHAAAAVRRDLATLAG